MGEARRRKKRPFKPRRWRIVRGSEYALSRVIFGALGLAGPRLGRSLGAGLGRLVHALDVRRRGQAVSNVLAARALVPDEAAARRLVRDMYRHLGMCLAEIGLMLRLERRGRLDEMVEFRGLDNVRQALAAGRGGILAVAHLGNWEPAGVAFSARHQPLHSVYSPLRNRFLDRFLADLRSRTGQVVIAKQNAAERMREVLRANQLLGILIDQDAGSEGVFVDFFGRPASTVKSLAILSLRHGSPVIPLNIYREGSRIFMVFEPPIDPASFAARPDRIRALTQQATSELERFIRAHPEQWYWLHRRWKTQPAASA